MKTISSSKRHFSDYGWLKTFWLFSFSDYYDPDNIQFGALRVFNDDIVEPGTGFPTHPHHEMEIITVVLDGEMTHKDSMGNTAVIKAGDVQRMSAGTGLTHSEFNLSDKPVHFYQIWIFPDTKGLKPSYDQKTFEPVQWKNKLLPIASGRGIPDTVTFFTDAAIFRSDLDEGLAISHNADSSRRIFIYLTSGELEVNGILLKSGDQARIEPENEINIKAMKNAAFIMIDVPSCRGWGYDGKTLRGEKAR
ncbi:MAG: pirin family protein [Firmicutes bacterium]|nr:pirin family protein [Bacillota bacterium]